MDVRTYMSDVGQRARIAARALARATTGVKNTALEAIAGLRVAFAPYLPFSTSALDDLFGPVDSWARPTVATGTTIAKPTPLFPKIDLDDLDLDGD